MLYKDWLRQWLSVCVKPTTKERTYEKYELVCRVHLIPALGNFELDRLTAGVLQGFVAEMTAHFSSNTVNVVISVLKNSLKKAVLYGAAEREFTGGISRPRASEKRVECFTQEEQIKIEKYISGSKKTKLTGILLCLYTGLRIGELIALAWSDIDFKEGTLSVAKSCHDGWKDGAYQKIIEMPKTNNSMRLIPIPKQLIGVLKRAKREVGGTYVVGGDDIITVRSYQRTFELLQRRLHIPHRGFHSLRHTFATRALECGMDVKTLSEILGHKNPTVTLNRYAHSLMEHKRLMMNRLGKLFR